MQTLRPFIQTTIVALAMLAAVLQPTAARAATITVTTLAETDESKCTLTNALFSANFNSEGWGMCAAGSDAGTDVITFEPGLAGTTELTIFGGLVISDDVELIGPGSGELTVRRAEAASTFRIFLVNPGTTARIEGMTISNGLLVFDNVISLGGAGITNSGDLTLDDVAVTDNHVTLEHDSANPATPGGGILNLFGATLTITDSTISENSLTVHQDATSGATSAIARGAGISSVGELTIDRSTIEGNVAHAIVSSPDGASASVWGAGIETSAETTTVRLSTISGNTALATAPTGSTTSTQGGGIWNQSTSLAITGSTIARNEAGDGANLHTEPSAPGAVKTITSTILSGPFIGSNCNATGVDLDGGNNLAHPSACGDLSALNIDPQLGPLADNGGPTMTHALPATSPAIDTGTSAGNPTDQRGLLRAVNFAPANAVDGADIGAFELQDAGAPTDPSVASPSHVVGKPSNDTTVVVTWAGAADALSGVDGFSYLWDTSPATLPDQVKDAEESANGSASPPLADGAHFFHLRTLDHAGNWTSTVHLGPLEIDTAPPETTITKKPKKRIETAKPRVRVRFAFTSGEPGTFLCKLDGKAQKPCTSPFTAKVKPGRHAFRVTAVDEASNLDPTPARYRFRFVPA